MNLNLLIMSTPMAQNIKDSWNDVLVSNAMIAVMCILILIFVGSALSALYKHLSAQKKTISIATLIICVLLLVLSGYNDMSRTTNTGASDNVGCYHQIKHLKAIYPKLPCNPISKSVCKKSSLNKASKANYKAKHTLTKHEAVQKYNTLKKYYRHTGVKSNGTKSLHPRAPKWYNYF